LLEKPGKKNGKIFGVSKKNGLWKIDFAQAMVGQRRNSPKSNKKEREKRKIDNFYLPFYAFA
jgi:hypothetical protein